MSDAAFLSARFQGEVGGFSLDVAFDAPPRGVTALFGPSGAGKSLTLRCIAGLERVPGRLAVGGDVWQDRKTFLAAHRRRVGYVFQAATLFPHLSVRANLEFGMKRAEPGARTLALDDAVALLGLGRFMGRRTQALSGGERQRVALGRALLAGPRLLLLDEPLSAVDALTKAEVLPYLEQAADALEIPTLLVSHDIGEVMRLADRVVQIADGRVLAAGPLAAMVERLGVDAGVPVYEESALLTGQVVEHDLRFRLTRLDCGGHRLVIPRVDLAVGAEVRVRVRARDVSIAMERPAAISIRNILAGVIVAMDHADDGVDVTLDVGAQRLRARITHEALEDLGLEIGADVFALVKSVSIDGRRG